MSLLPETGLTSAPLIRLLSVAVAGGNAVAEVSTGWSLLDRVILMARPMSEGLATKFRADPALTYYAEPQSTHWPGDRGFVDEACGEALSFPLEGERASA